MALASSHVPLLPIKSRISRYLLVSGGDFTTINQEPPLGSWNGTPAGATGAFEGYLASLPPVLGLGFGAFGEWSSEVDTLIGQMADIASEVPERLGCCHGPTEARGRYAHWARKNLHRASLRELSRCRHAALDRILLLPTETYVGDPDQCSRMDDSPDDPGISNAWDSSDSCGASGGDPTVAPRRHCWTVVRSTAACPAFCSRL